MIIIPIFIHEWLRSFALKKKSNSRFYKRESHKISE